MSRQPPPAPPFFPEPFAHSAHTGSTNTRQNVTGDSVYQQGGSAPGHAQPLEIPSPTDYPSQQSYSSQRSPASSRRSTLPTTPTFDHASLPPHPPAPPPLSGSTSYNPPFPVPAVQIGHPSTNPSGPAPAPSPILHRAATIPMPVHANTASLAPYDMPPNTMHSLSQPGIGGPQSTAPGYGNHDVHERYDDSSNFRDENLEQSRGGARHSGGEHRVKGPPNHFSAGRQQGGPYRPKPPELLRCMICRRVVTRAEAEYRRWYCVGGHMGQWQPA